MKNLFKYFAVTFLLLSDVVMFAQDTIGGGGGPNEGGDPLPAPINSKLVVLMAVGFIFAFYFIKNNKKTLES